MFLFGLDLKSEWAFCHPAKNSFAEVIDAHRQTGLCSVDGSSAANNPSSLRRPLWWTSQSPAFQLSGSVPVDGIRAIDVSRKPARYRSLSSGSVFQTLPSRHSFEGRSQHLGQCQRNSGLAHLLRLCSESDCYGTTSLRQRTLWSGSQGYRLRSGCHDHRSVSFGIPVGAVPFDQGSYQAAHAARSARQYPVFHSYQRWQVARGQRTRRIDHRAWSFLRHGPRLHRFRTLGAAERGGQFLCHSRQVQSQSPAPLFPQGRQKHRPDLRPNGDAHRLLLAPRLRCATEKNQIQRSRDWENSGLSHKQLCPAGSDHYSALPLSLAGRVVLQVDQATSAYQSFLRHHRERGQNSNLDRDLGLRAHSHRQKTAQLIGQSLRTPTDFEHHCLRESFSYSTTYPMRTSQPINDSSKPIEFVQITLGHLWYYLETQNIPLSPFFKGGSSKLMLGLA